MDKATGNATRAIVTSVSLLGLILWPGGDAHSQVNCPPDAPTERSVEQALDRGRAVLAAYQSPLKAKGLLDVTAPPYNAVGDGQTDDTCALQRALDDGRDARLTIYLPAGTYLVSKTLQGVQYRIDKDHKTTYAEAAPFGGDMRHHDFPIIVTGSSVGRARIRLADGAFAGSAGRRPVLYLWARGREAAGYLEQPNTAYSLFVGKLDIITGNNPNAVGLDLQGAQNTAIADVHVDARGGFAGIRGLPGSGGSAAHLSVQGGQYGLYAAPIDYDSGLELSSWHQRGEGGAQPGPVVAVADLWGQSKAAVFYNARGPLTLVGAHIRDAGIEATGTTSFRGGLNIIDSVLDLKAGPAVSSNRPVYFERAYVRGATEIVQFAAASALTGAPTGWTSIGQAALSPDLAAHPIYLDGISQSDTSWTRLVATDVPDVTQLQARHSYGPQAFPAWDRPGTVDVTEPPYSIDASDAADDHAALQQAIADNPSKTLFLPKGVYYLSKPLELASHTRLVGVGGTYSALLPLAGAAAFADANNPQPLVRTQDDAAATTVLASLRIHFRKAGAYAVHWRAGERSLYRDVNIRLYPWSQLERTNYPLVRISDNGGGRWFHTLAHQYILNMGPNHRELLVENTRNALVFYHLNPEHGGGDLQVELNNAHNVTVYNLKSEIEGQISGASEGAPSLGIINQCEQVALYGFSGIAAPEVGHAVIEVRDAKDFLLVNLQQQRDTAGAYVVRETSGTHITTVPNAKRVALYRRGDPQLALPLPVIAAPPANDGGVADAAHDAPTDASAETIAPPDGVIDAGGLDGGAEDQAAGDGGAPPGDGPEMGAAEGPAGDAEIGLAGGCGCQAASPAPPTALFCLLVLAFVYRARRRHG